MDDGTPGNARGISLYDFSPKDGRLNFKGYFPADNPSYVVSDVVRGLVYLVHELEKGAGAAVSVVRVQVSKKEQVKFKEICRVAIPGDHPCHATLTPKELVVTCYTSSQVMILPLGKDGSVSEVRQTFDFASAGSDASHTHCTTYLSRPNRLLITDLGADKLRTLLATGDGTFRYAPEYDFNFEEHHGPRHLSLHPSGRVAVVNGECKGYVHLLDLSELQPGAIHGTNLLPAQAVAEAKGAAIRFSADGRVVYTTDRQFNLINSVRLDRRSNCLRFLESIPCGGDHPRDLILSPDGEWLLTANTISSTVGVFHVNPKGELTHHHTFRKIPTPTAFAWL